MSNPIYSAWMGRSGGAGLDYETIEEENEDEETAAGGGSRDHRRRKQLKYKSFLPKCLLNDDCEDEDADTSSANPIAHEPPQLEVLHHNQKYSHQILSKDAERTTTKANSSEEHWSDQKFRVYQEERKPRTHLSHSFCGVIAREPEEQHSTESGNWSRGHHSQLKTAFSENLIAKKFRKNMSHKQGNMSLAGGIMGHMNSEAKFEYKHGLI